ncbi:MAG: hypothetical protein F6J96_35265 [Symploca sp. SIO1C2]|nr:hypothetical protein [Symploca sp. SIO1C2]
MKIKSAVIGLIAGMLAILGTTEALSQYSSGRVEFICREGYDPQNGQYVPTTFAWTGGEKTAIIRWRSDSILSAGDQTETRCNAVAYRLQTYYDSDRLHYLSHGIMNRQKVICVTDNLGSSCSGLLFTLRPQDNPDLVLEQLRDILKGTRRSIINQNSGVPQLYLQINIDELLKILLPGDNSEN